MPNLRKIDLGGVETTHITVNYDMRTDLGGQVHQISVHWIDSSFGDIRQRGISLRVSKEKVIFLDVKNAVTKLHIVALSATQIHLKGCGALKELDIECPLLVELVVGNSPPTIKKMVESLSKVSPWLRKVTMET